LKEFIIQNGGRELVWEDILILQDHVRLTTVALCAATGVPAFVVSGCKITQQGPTYRMAAGVVYLNGQLRRLQATSGLTFPAEIVADTPVVTDERRYEDGGSSAGASESFAIVRPATTQFAAKIPVPNELGALTYPLAMAAAARALGQIEWGYFQTGFGEDGLGVGVHAGWALCDGRNATADLRGRVPVGWIAPGLSSISIDALRPEYENLGLTGGLSFVQLTEGQIPPHSHQIEFGNSFLGGGALNVLGKGNNESRLIQTGTTGGGQAHENRPPFMVLVARQWVGF
jgi:hypothetical protein